MNKGVILANRLKSAFRAFAEHEAIDLGMASYTYAEMETLSVSISNAIFDLKDDGNKFVAILGAKTLFTYAGICGTLWASKSYMPLNLKYPVARIARMLELSGCSVIIADTSAGEMLNELLYISEHSYTVVINGDVKPWTKKFNRHVFISVNDHKGKEPPTINAKHGDTAYLLFTSGTTGTPKGVPVSNSNVVAYLDHILSTWNFSYEDRFSHTFDLTFDLSVHDMMVCWLSGACLCVPQDDSPLKMSAYIRDQAVSVWFSVPSVGILMDKMRLLKKKSLETLRISFFCGEPLPESIASKWQEATGGHTTVNLYGPSEATIAISAYSYEKGMSKSKNGTVSIGKLFPGQEYILLDHDHIRKTDRRGEICLSGSQLINAYLNDTALSEKYFIGLDDYPGKQWYRTGDLAEVDEEGDLFFLGRIDTEVKISGYRVNMLEIDAIVSKTTGTEMVASIFDDSTTSRIVTFVEGVTSDKQEIINSCKQELPWYMIPEVIIFVDEMPLNVNGKIDRNKLKTRLHE